jgi:hypothetical protein
MKVEGWLFAGMAIFYAIVTVAYWFIAGEIVGTVALTLTGFMAIIIGFYALFTGRRVGARPEDLPFAEIEDADPDYGFFSPHSWWPLPVAASAAFIGLGLIFAWWMVLLGIFALLASLIGLVFEYYRGEHVLN